MTELPVAASLRKRLDLRLLPWVAVGYIVNGLDRNNLNNAYSLGMDVDLDMAKNNGVALTNANFYFFITYVTLQVVVNMFIPRIRPSIFLPSIMILWGGVAASMAACTNVTQLYWARAALGIAEAGFYPGVVYLLGTWYPKTELGLRLTVFALGQQLGSSFSGVISAVLATVQSSSGGGIASWRLLFITEGIISVMVAIPGFFLLPDYPTNTKWLPEDEKKFALKRMEDQGTRVKYTGYSWAIVKNIVVKPYFYLFLIILPSLLFLPQIISNFIFALKNSGWSTITANWMTVPVYIFAGITFPIVGWSSDRFKDRFFHGLIGVLYTMVAYSLLMVNDANAPTWLLFLVVYMVAPMASIFPLMLTWVNEIWRVDNQTRALAIAIFNAVSNIVINYLNTYIWLPGDAPRYILGKGATIGVMGLCAIAIVIVGLLERNSAMLPIDKDGHTALDGVEAKDDEEVAQKLENFHGEDPSAKQLLVAETD